MSENISVQNSTIPSLFWNKVYQNKEIIGIVTGLVIGILGYCIALDFSTSLGEWATHVKYISVCTGGMIFLISFFLKLDSISSSEVRIRENPSQIEDNGSKSDTSSKNQPVQTPKSPISKLTLLQELKNYLSNGSAQTPELTQSFFNRIYQDDNREAFILLVKAKKFSLARDNMIDMATVGHANVFDGMCELNPTLAQEVINLDFLNRIFHTHANNSQTVYRFLHSISLNFPAQFRKAFILLLKEKNLSLTTELTQSCFKIICQNDDREAFILLLKEKNLVLTPELTQSFFNRIYNNDDREAFILFVRAKNFSFARDNMIEMATAGHANIFDGMCELNPTLAQEVINLDFLNRIFDAHANSPQTIYRLLHSISLNFPARFNEFIRGCDQRLTNVFNQLVQLDAISKVISQDDLENYTQLAIFLLEKNVETNLSVRLRQAINLRRISLVDVIVSRRNHYHVDDSAGKTLLHHAMSWDILYDYLMTKREIFEAPERRVVDLPNGLRSGGLRSGLSSTPSSALLNAPVRISSSSVAVVPQPNVEPVGILPAVVNNARIDVNAQNSAGNTALHDAIFAGRWLKIYFLITQLNANAEIQNHDGRSAYSLLRSRYSIATPNELEEIRQLLMLMLAKSGTPKDQIANQISVIRADTKTEASSFNRGSFTDKMNTALEFSLIDHVKPYVKFLNVEDFAAETPIERFLQNLLVQYRVNPTRSKKELLELLLQQKEMIASSSFDRRSFIDKMNTALDLDIIVHVKPYIKLLNAEDFATDSLVMRFLQNLIVRYKADRTNSKKELLESLLQQKSIVDTKTGSISFDRRSFVDTMNTALDLNSIDHVKPYIKFLTVEDFAAESPIESFLQNLIVQNRANPTGSKKELLELLLQQKGVPAQEISRLLKSNAQMRMEMETAQRAAIENAQSSKASSSKDPYIPLPLIERLTVASNNEAHEFTEALFSVILGMELKSNAQMRMEMEAAQGAAIESPSSSNDDPFAVDSDHEINDSDDDLDRDNESLQIMKLMAFGNPI